MESSSRDTAEPEAAPVAFGAVRPQARILIVDDDERNAFAASQALEDLGHELVIARSGEDALRKLLHDDFAVILLDLHMPGMDGYETARYIRGHYRMKDTPIVFLTAVFRDEAHLFQAYSAGAVDVVFKPVDPFILRSKVSVLVDLHLKTVETARQAEHLQELLDENVRVQAEKRATELALKRTQERQETILRSLPVVFCSREAVEPFKPLFLSEGVSALTGFSADTFMDDPAFGFERIHPEDRGAVARALRSALESGVYACEYRWLCADGGYRVFIDQGVLALGEDGEAPEIHGTLLDSTDRRLLEQELAQARKMEAVGQLTGGVAHDFNNLLTVILGNVDLITRKLDEGDRMNRQLAAVRHAAERGRTLTRQLLAFSRRQHLSPVAIDLNAQIREFVPLMQQAVGEAVTILAPQEPDLFCVRVDPAHLESALLNLAVNARDAMPNGGTLTLRTAAAASPPGTAGEDERQWVRIEVEDTGVGMDPGVAERVFEPFFTTKEVGHGSGLGLSQVYGFVRQSGGHVSVKSQPGKGATFELCLPISPDSVIARGPESVAEEVQGGAERILVVEDDPDVLSLTVDMLKGLGYVVSTAANAKAALQQLRSRKPIDLMFTDVVMPGGMSGVQLARLASEIRPQLGILLTSGYVGDKSPIAENEFPLIDKPYERATLAAKLRQVLAGPPPTLDEAPRRAMASN
jgi:signal transduction histidine kinase/FixJ family two-component response regulator